jgi:hypothetical protein
MADNAAPNPPPSSGGNNPARRRVDGTFIAALIFTLRARGISVGPAEAATCISLGAMQSDWAAAELGPVLQAALIRRPDDAPVFARVFADVFTARPVAARAVASRPPSAAKTAKEHPEQPPGPGPEGSLPRSFSDRLRVRIISVSNRASALLPAPQYSRRLATAAVTGAIIIAVLVWARDLPLPRPSSASSGGPLLSSMLYAIPAACLLVAVALGVWCALELRPKPAPPDTPPGRKLRLRPVERLAADRTVFRTGSIGGQPTPFLTLSLATEIAELFGYRPGEPDRARLDARRTIAARTRGEDPATIYFVPRRELPTVLLLIDVSSEARFWNTLPREFADALTARGVALDRIEFPGSFFSRNGGQWLPRPQLEFVEGAIAVPGWTVTVMFAEAHRLAERDVFLLRRVIENGPVLFLELRDPALWDEPQLAIEDIGAIVSPATGSNLRDGLAALFAPDRVVDIGIHAIAPAALDEADGTQDTLEQRLGDALDWAGECALIQPVSFALAEQLRARHPKLAGTPLAFSRLAALPGSFVGPEGLRFEARTRRALLGKFAARSPAQRTTVLGVIDNAIDSVPAKGTTAETLRRYTRAQARLFDIAPDNALLDLFEISEQGVIDPDPVREFLGRLRPPGYVSDEHDDRSLVPQPIFIPAEPFAAAARIEISNDTDGYRLSGERIVPAQWSVATAEVRFRLDATAANRDGVAAAFLPSGDEILCDGGYDSRTQSTVLLLLNSVNATRSRIAIQSAQGIRRIVVAEDARTAAVWIGNHDVHVLRFPDRSGESEPQRIPIDLKDWENSPTPERDEAPLLALDPAGRVLAIRGPSPQRLRFFDGQSGAPRNSISLDGEVESLVLIDADSAVVALRNGQLCRIDLRGDKKIPDVIAGMEGVPTNLTVIRRETPPRPVLIGMGSGQILFRWEQIDTTGSAAPVEIVPALSPLAELIVCLPFEDRAAARLTDAKREAGICVAALFRDGSFNVLGLPLDATGLTRGQGYSGAPWLSSSGATGSPQRAFSPMSLLDRPFGPSRDGSFVVAVAKGARKLAAVHRGRLEIRPLVYELAKPIGTDASEAAAQSQSEPVVA